jgi:hypothetical protein
VDVVKIGFSWKTVDDQDLMMGTLSETPNKRSSETYTNASAVGSLRRDVSDVDVYKKSWHRKLLSVDLRDRLGQSVFLLFHERIGVFDIIKRHFQFERKSA